MSIFLVMILLFLSEIESNTTSDYKKDIYNKSYFISEKERNFEQLIYCPYEIYRHLPYIPVSNKDGVQKKTDKLEENKEIYIEEVKAQSEKEYLQSSDEVLDKNKQKQKIDYSTTDKILFFIVLFLGLSNVLDVFYHLSVFFS